jgi:hypothetical protein
MELYRPRCRWSSLERLGSDCGGGLKHEGLCCRKNVGWDLAGEAGGRLSVLSISGRDSGGEARGGVRMGSQP